VPEEIGWCATYRRAAVAHRSGRILADVAKRWLAWTGVWGVVSALAFLVLYWVIALAVAIMGAIALLVAVMASDWDSHPSFDDRERERARRRKEKYARGSAAREKDRARWEAHQAKRASRG
jgi:hypothetical protein